MTSIIVHQDKDCSEDLRFNIPLEWTVHHTPFGIMDIYGWLNAMTQLSDVCGASPVNNQIIFFDRHGSHFDGRALIHMEFQNIQPFVLKAGDYGNNHPNDNVTNSKLKSHYNEVKSVWMLKYGTTKMLPHHINSILVESQ